MAQRKTSNYKKIFKPRPQMPPKSRLAKWRSTVFRLVRTRLPLVRRALQSRWFAIGYAVGAAVVLGVTTVFWAVLGATVQQGNADQLVNGYLFENHATLQGANFPGQHTFLLKWPLFWLLQLFHGSASAYSWVTIGVVLITVAALVVVLQRIERRPLVFGTLCLALASVLLLVPAQPYPGGLLPVNMAMVTTRNVEYVLYIGALILLVRAPRLRSGRFWLAVLIMAVLVASDKLFLTLGAGAAVVACLVYALARKWSTVTLSARWLVMMLAAAAGSAALLWVATAGHIAHITSESTLGPYGFVHTAKDVALGAVYGGLGLLSNFGANPADDTRLLHNVPHQAQHNLLGWGGISLVVNVAILALGIYAALRLLLASVRLHDKTHSAAAVRLAVLLVWTAAAAFGVFVVSKHYYPVDARYLAITLFALSIAGATYLRQRQVRFRVLMITGAILCLSIMAGLITANHTYHREQAALAPIAARNKLVAQALAHHPVNVLVGDYWRVVPIRLASSKHLRVMPLTACTLAQDILSSSTWRPDLGGHSFAYLLSADAGLTPYPHCTLDQVVKAYGRPNASIVVAGSLSRPKELLLVYDKGIHHSSPPLAATPSRVVPTVTPIDPADLPHTGCAEPTIMNVVAHQDDDLLFMNPDLYQDIKKGHCVRTVYITAGDAGGGQFYWLNREQGAEAAYATMTGQQTAWVQRIVKLSDHQFITVASPRGNYSITLIFMHLPDGNVSGSGFAASHFESLARLQAGHIPTLHSVDEHSSYTSAELTDALVRLMYLYQPAEIRTQANVASKTSPDHSDHIAVGRYVHRAYQAYEQRQYENRVVIPLNFYWGYPKRTLPENVSGQDLQDVERIFFAYATYDSGVCHNEKECERNPNTYHAYLRRSYTLDLTIDQPL